MDLHGPYLNPSTAISTCRYQDDLFSSIFQQKVCDGDDGHEIKTYLDVSFVHTEHYVLTLSVSVRVYFTSFEDHLCVKNIKQQSHTGAEIHLDLRSPVESRKEIHL